MPKASWGTNTNGPVCARDSSATSIGRRKAEARMIRVRGKPAALIVRPRFRRKHPHSLFGTGGIVRTRGKRGPSADHLAGFGARSSSGRAGVRFCPTNLLIDSEFILGSGAICEFRKAGIPARRPNRAKIWCNLQVCRREALLADEPAGPICAFLCREGHKVEFRRCDPVSFRTSAAIPTGKELSAPGKGQGSPRATARGYERFRRPHRSRRGVAGTAITTGLRQDQI